MAKDGVAMRTEQEMIQKVLQVGGGLPQVKAIGISGSRGNPDAPRDIFQDYDVIFVVEELSEMLTDRRWLEDFGQRLIMQTPEEMTLSLQELGDRFTFLMLFEDGVRVDLTLCPVTAIDQLKEDPFVVPLHDPLELFKGFPEPSDELFWVKAPTEAEFQDCLNEFWWVTTYVVKGLWRNELFYATDHLYDICQGELLRMMGWRVAKSQNYRVSLGKNYKYLPDHLDAVTISKLDQLRDFSSREKLWQSLFLTQALFEAESRDFAASNGFSFDEEQPVRLREYAEYWYRDQQKLKK